MKEIDKKSSKPIQHDLRLERALASTGGLNPLTIDNKVARFRCNQCGTLLGVSTRDMEGEFEHRCPICGLCMVFNRKPRKLPQAQMDAYNRMFSWRL